MVFMINGYLFIYLFIHGKKKLNENWMKIEWKLKENWKKIESKQHLL